MLLPSGISNLLCWWKGDTALYNATTGGTAVTSDGAIIERIEDQSGNSNHLTQSNGTNQAIYDAALGMAVFPLGYNAWMNYSCASASNQAVTWFFVGDLVNTRKPYDGSANQTYHVPVSATSNAFNVSYDRTGTWQVYDNNGSAPRNCSSANAVIAGSTVYVAIVSNASGVTTYVNGVAQSGAYGSALLSGTFTGGYVGSHTQASFPGQFVLRDMGFFSRALSAAEVSSLVPYAQSRGVSPTYSANLVFTGDSLSYGYQGIYHRGLVQQIGTLPGVRVINTAECSMTAATLSTEDVSRSAGYYLPGVTNIAVVWAGTNDMAMNSTTPAATYAYLQTVCSTWTNAGFKVIVCPAIARASLSGANQTTYNGLIQSGFTGATLAAAAFANWRSDPQIGDGVTPATPVYAGDSIHLTPMGYTIPDRYLRAILNTMLPGQQTVLVSPSRKTFVFSRPSVRRTVPAIRGITQVIARRPSPIVISRPVIRRSAPLIAVTVNQQSVMVSRARPVFVFNRPVIRRMAPAQRGASHLFVQRRTSITVTRPMIRRTAALVSLVQNVVVARRQFVA